jgi:hypothetical protein
MRSFTKITPRFWTPMHTTSVAVRREGPDALLMALYLQSCPMSNALGLFYIPVAVMSHETGLEPRRVEAALEALQRADFAEYCPEEQVVWIPEMAAEQLGRTLKAQDHRVKWVRRELSTLEASRFHAAFLARYGAAYHLGAEPGGETVEPPRPRKAESPADRGVGGPVSAPQQPVADRTARRQERWPVAVPEPVQRQGLDESPPPPPTPAATAAPPPVEERDLRDLPLPPHIPPLPPGFIPTHGKRPVSDAEAPPTSTPKMVGDPPFPLPAWADPSNVEARIQRDLELERQYRELHRGR